MRIGFDHPILSSTKEKTETSTSKSRIDKVGVLLRRALLLLARVIPGVLAGDLAGGAGVELIQDALGDTVEQFLGVDAEQVPGDIEGFKDATGLVWRLADEGTLELLEEFEGELVFGGKSFLADDGLHGGYFGKLERKNRIERKGDTYRRHDR